MHQRQKQTDPHNFTLTQSDSNQTDADRWTSFTSAAVLPRYLIPPRVSEWALDREMALAPPCLSLRTATFGNALRQHVMCILM